MFALFGALAPARAQDAAAFFRQNCASCHTIGGGKLTGPDLKGVAARRERDWLLRFIVDPPGLIASGDPQAQRLQREARGVVMPRVAGMSPARARELLDLIETESKLPRSQFVGARSAQRALTPADVEVGRAIFSGSRRLADGGPACISCHSVRGIGALGGGRLGPDLTGAYGRLGGQQALASWLSSPAGLVMQPVYRAHPIRPDEALGLVAYLKQSGKRGGAARSGTVNFVLLGIVGTVGALVLFDLGWRKRFRSVRRVMVRGGDK